MERENNESGRLKDRPYKAFVGAAIPFVLMFLRWYATGEFDAEELTWLAASLLTGGGVYSQSNRPKSHDHTRRA